MHTYVHSTCSVCRGVTLPTLHISLCILLFNRLVQFAGGLFYPLYTSPYAYFCSIDLFSSQEGDYPSDTSPYAYFCSIGLFSSHEGDSTHLTHLPMHTSVQSTCSVRRRVTLLILRISVCILLFNRFVQLAGGWLYSSYTSPYAYFCSLDLFSSQEGDYNYLTHFPMHTTYVHSTCSVRRRVTITILHISLCILLFNRLVQFAGGWLYSSYASPYAYFCSIDLFS